MATACSGTVESKYGTNLEQPAPPGDRACSTCSWSNSNLEQPAPPVSGATVFGMGGSKKQAGCPAGPGWLTADRVAYKVGV